ncbi:unnamed protein product [Trichogramma brassicae]|uniref:Uncharacterized protein n=1 Tax=Trichogramma brassicae TaxID=86971 RepID=A0A6H5I0M8_9HYME|nr:unnamed protein product [Trichogramma brassicae]
MLAGARPFASGLSPSVLVGLRSSFHEDLQASTCGNGGLVRALRGIPMRLVIKQCQHAGLPSSSWQLRRLFASIRPRAASDTRTKAFRFSKYFDTCGTSCAALTMIKKPLDSAIQWTAPLSFGASTTALFGDVKVSERRSRRTAQARLL